MALTDRTIAQLEERGIDVEVAAALGWSSCDRLGCDTLRIPFVRNGRVVNHKYRTLGKKKSFCMDADAELCLFNGDCIADKTLAEQPLIVTEGEMDAIAVMQAGYQRVVSVPNGSPGGNPGQYNAIKHYAWMEFYKSALKDVREVILAVDADQAGANLMSDLAIRFGRPKCKWVRYPEGCKDLNDVLLRHGQGAVVECLSKAMWFRVEGVYLPSELPPTPRAVPYEIGMEALDEHYRMRMGDFVVVTGIPSMGKSTWLNDVLCRVAHRYDWRIAILTFEQGGEDLKDNLTTWFCGKHVNACSPQERQQALRWMDQHFVVISPSLDDDPTLKWCQEKIFAAVVQYGANVVVIDPWNEMEHTTGFEMTMHEYIGKAIRELKRTAQAYHIHLIVVAHPKKMTKDKEGKLLIPTLYDISDCHAADTEILTKRGWIKHEDATTDDVVMCFDPETGGSFWGSPKKVISHDHAGEMIRFSGRGYDMLVTENHRMVVKPAWAEPVGSTAITGIGRPIKWPKDEWLFSEAAELERTRAAFVIPKAGLAQEGDNPDFVLIDGHQYPSNEFFELVGWWVAEGCFQSCGASLCQAVGDQADRIDELIAACGFKATRAVRQDPRGYKDVVTWYFGARKCRHFVEWLRDKCGSGAANKRAPYPIWGMHPLIKASFLNGYIAGDGHRPSNRHGFSCCTTSSQLYDDLMRLAVEIGIPVCGNRRLKNGKSHHSDSFQVSFGSDMRQQVTMRPARNVKRERYEGKVWCLTVPTGAYFIRRDGKVSVSGNSAHWFNKPEVGIVVHRDEKGDTIIRVAKSRYHDKIGKPGEIKFYFNPQTNRYSQMPKSENWA